MSPLVDESKYEPLFKITEAKKSAALAVMQGIIILVIAFGVSLTDAQTAAIFGVTTALLAAMAAFQSGNPEIN
jgi:hypothetical protein